MTGFGRAKQTVSDLDITVEIKSVNHRYFEFSSRLPRAYQFLDEKLKSFCQQRVSRGKVEVSVMIEDRSENAIELEVNEQYADAYIKALRAIGERYALADDITVSSLIGNNEIFTARRHEMDDEVLTAAVMQVADEAVANFIAMRAAEGERLVKDVTERTQTILKCVEFIESRSPETVKEYRERIEQKIRELIGDVQVDEQRLLTETAIFADKIAVAEETVRLRSHINSLVGMLEGGGAIGRKLDFTVQEMNREANTIGSKAQDIEINRTVVNIKSEIEKIREQIQNIE
ncbi:MAG: YicC family protein [Clostridia bacterium]|nr:YicC family protein [Clostridia bacterium]